MRQRLASRRKSLGSASRLSQLAGLALVLSGCGSTPAQEPVEGVEQPIFGGQDATTCQWPTTVLLDDAGCSGTLVSPQIVVTAAHCGTKISKAMFGEHESARDVAIEFCKTYQGDNGPNGSDWAFCKLVSPVLDVPIVPILMGCETDILRPGLSVVVAGFGASRTGNNDGYGTKRWVTTTVNALDKGDGIQVGGNGKAPCYGDSGGPAFVKLQDGSWRVFGIDSAGLDDGCTSGDLMALIHKAVPWIEQQSGVDITPCHDADGTWNPSPQCTRFSLTPDSTGRSWSNGCAEPELSGPSATCGSPLAGLGGAGGAGGRGGAGGTAGAQALGGAGGASGTGGFSGASGNPPTTAGGGTDGTAGTGGMAGTGALAGAPTVAGSTNASGGTAPLGIAGTAGTAVVGHSDANASGTADAGCACTVPASTPTTENRALLALAALAVQLRLRRRRKPRLPAARCCD